MLNHRLFDMQNPRDNLCCAALSDNEKLKQLYSSINYEIKYISRNKEIKISFIDYALKGELVAIYSLCVLNALSKDIDKLKKSLSVFKSTIETTKKAIVLQTDYEFLDSLANSDKDVIKSKIEEFLTPKLHKQRMRHDSILADFISQPAILYLKLCWILNIQIEINHKYIPMELMPLNPLGQYPDTYLELIR